MNTTSFSIYQATKASVLGSTSTGLDQIINIITHDPGILSSGSTESVNGGAQAANGLNNLIIEGALATNSLADGIFTTVEVAAIGQWIRADPSRLAQFVSLHGDDDGTVETGYHLLQNDGGSFVFNNRNFANTIVDGIYHIGFGTNTAGQFLNEDGNANASLANVTRWLNQLHVRVVTHEETTLSRVAWGILSDTGLYNKFGIVAQREIARAADTMNGIIAQGIAATGIGSDGHISSQDVVTLNGWLRSDPARLAEFLRAYGDAKSGFYKAVDDASDSMFGQNMVNTVANGIYSLGFSLVDNNVGSLGGNAGQSLDVVASYLNAIVGARGQFKTGSGLDRIVDTIFADPGLAIKTSMADIQKGAKAAAGLNHLLLEAMDAVGARTDGWITPDELRDINAWVKADPARYAQFLSLHGNDENGVETGYHLVQNDGGTTTLENRNLINTVADGIYHFGFEIKGNNFVNEDGDINQSLSDVAIWLNELMNNVVTIRAKGGNEPVTWTESSVQVISSNGSRSITTGDYDDYVNATWSSALIKTGGGNDVIRAGQGDDTVDGGEGSDTYLYANSVGTLFHGYDRISDSGVGGTDRIVASGQDSTIGVRGFSGSGVEIIDVTGVSGKAVLLDTNASNTIDLRNVAVLGDLLIDNARGSDTVYGSSGADKILGGLGDDTLDGGEGGDIYLYTDSADAMFQGYDKISDTGNVGIDRIVATGANSTIGVVGFAPTNGIEMIDVTGVVGKAVLLDNNSANTIDLRHVKIAGDLLVDGGLGNDQIFGNVGHNRLMGGGGADLLNGGGGDDTLTGGTGKDIFQFTANSGNDVITDFERGWDRIDLRGAGVSSFADLKMSSQGADTLIAWNGGSVLVQGFSPGMIAASNFVI